MRQRILALVAGVVFAIGLGISGMVLPSKVIGFLDVTGDWDPSLAFVMAGAVAVHAAAYRLLWWRGAAAAAQAPDGPRGLRFPIFASALDVPARQGVDTRLIAGAALFGVGWGLGGYCPGPALVSLATGAPAVILFVVAMIMGMWTRRLVVER